MTSQLLILQKSKIWTKGTILPSHFFINLIFWNLLSSAKSRAVGCFNKVCFICRYVECNMCPLGHVSIQFYNEKWPSKPSSRDDSVQLQALIFFLNTNNISVKCRPGSCGSEIVQRHSWCTAHLLWNIFFPTPSTLSFEKKIRCIRDTRYLRLVYCRVNNGLPTLFCICFIQMQDPLYRTGLGARFPFFVTRQSCE